MSEKTQFTNKALFRAFQEIQPLLQNRKLFLDNLSEDIKSLEKKLNEYVCPLGITLEYKINYVCDVIDTITNACFDEFFNRVSCGSMTEVYYSLGWDKSSTGSPRLVHKISKKHFFVFFKNGGHPAIDIWREIDRIEDIEYRPLIECNAHTRIEASDFLPDLLESVRQALSHNSPITVVTTSAPDVISWQEAWKQEARKLHPYSESEVPL